MPAFDLGECLHDPEFAPSREGPTNRFLNIYMTVCTTDMYVCVGMYAENRKDGFLLQKNSRFSLPSKHDGNIMRLRLEHRYIL